MLFVGFDQLVLKPNPTTKSTAHGTLVMKLSAPHSNRKPSWRLVSKHTTHAVQLLEQRDGQAGIQFHQAVGCGETGNTAPDDGHPPAGR